MTRQNGFVPLFVLIIGAMALTAAGSVAVFNKNSKTEKPSVIVEETPFPSVTATPTPTVSPIPTQTAKIPETPAMTVIKVIKVEMATKTPDKPQQDTIPPVTNIYYPQSGGTITYKTVGKICAIATQPSDNTDPAGIETEYKFDESGWSGFAANRAYLCADALANGSHTLHFHSKDKSGNIEEVRSLGFNVNIEGN